MRVTIGQAIRWVFVASLFTGLCGRLSAALVSYPDSPEGLGKLIDDTFDALKRGDADRAKELIRSMEMPDHNAWFRKTFGDEVGAAIAIEYGRRAPLMELELTRAFEDRIQDGHTFVKAIKLESPDDENATGLQKTAMQSMRTKVTLYTVKLGAQPGGGGYSLWSWVYYRGSFRIVGKMDAVRNRPVPAEMPAEMPTTSVAPAAVAGSGAAAVVPTEPAPAPGVVATPGAAPAVTPNPLGGVPPAVFPVPATGPALAATPVADLAEPSADVLKTAFENLVAVIQARNDNEAAAIVRSIMLPDSESWYIKTFGEELGRPMAEQYLAELAAGMEKELLDDLRAQIAKGRTQVIAYKIDGADDPKAEDRQKQAIARMVHGHALYGVRLTEPGLVTGSHYRSFVFVDGKFRLAGRMSIAR